MILSLFLDFYAIYLLVALVIVLLAFWWRPKAGYLLFVFALVLPFLTNFVLEKGHALYYVEECPDSPEGLSSGIPDGGVFVASKEIPAHLVGKLGNVPHSVSSPSMEVILERQEAYVIAYPRHPGIVLGYESLEPAPELAPCKKGSQLGDCLGVLGKTRDIYWGAVLNRVGRRGLAVRIDSRFLLWSEPPTGPQLIAQWDMIKLKKNDGWLNLVPYKRDFFSCSTEELDFAEWYSRKKTN